MEHQCYLISSDKGENPNKEKSLDNDMNNNNTNSD